MLCILVCCAAFTAGVELAAQFIVEVSAVRLKQHDKACIETCSSDGEVVYHLAL